MNILLLAYACEPGAGSEYGVGWMVPLTMATRYPDVDIYVLTRSRCKEKIEQEEKPANLHFMFYDIPMLLYYKREMGSTWGEQYNYTVWQLLSRAEIKRLHRKYSFDIIHHLTFNQYRTPSAGYWMDIPFIVGPIGGAECIPKCFWQDLSCQTKKKEKIRSRGLDRKIFHWFNTRSSNKKVILCSSDENLKRLNTFGGKDTEFRLLPAIGFSNKDFLLSPYKAAKDSSSFEILYAGKALDWKGLHIFLKSVKTLLEHSADRAIHVSLVGIRFDDEQEMVGSWLDELGLRGNVTLTPFIKRADLLQMMQDDCSLSVYPAFRDSGSMSVLEASALGLPTICFNTGGQDIFPDDILLKVPVADTYDETLKAFSEKIIWAYRHPEELREVGERAKAWVNRHLTWERKVEQYMEIYNSILK